MPTADRRPVRLRIAMAVVLVAAVFATGLLLVVRGQPRFAPPPQPWQSHDAPSNGAGQSSVPSGTTVSPLPPATPTRIRIPSIAVNAPLTGLNLLPGGHLAAPPDSDRNLAGWYQAGTTPGQTGTAIIDGHVDTYQGPAVFYDLGALKKGYTVDVDRSDRTTAVFTIDAVEVYSADAFPSTKVYAAAGRPELRLITCGAGFDRARQEYLGNVVVYAHLTSAHHA